MKSEAYVSLARNYSIIAVVAVIVGADTSGDYYQTIQHLAAARRDFAQDLLVTLGKNLQMTNHLSAESFWSTLEPMLTTTNDLPNDRLVCSTGWQPQQIENDGYRLAMQVPDVGQVWIDKPAIVSVRGNGNGHLLRWQASIPSLDINPKASECRLKHLKNVYQDVWHQEPTNNTVSKIYSDIEYRIFEGKNADIPGLGIACSLKLAAVALPAIIITLLVQVHSLMRQVYRDPKHGIEEPWLLLDGKTGFERMFAFVWLYAVAFSPLVATGLLGVIVWSEWCAQGKVLGLLGSSFRLTCLAVFLCLSIPVSMSVRNLLLKVRHVR